MEEGYCWPDFWPPLESFLGPLRHFLVFIDFKPLTQGDETVIRFENGYGVHLLRNPLQEWLSEVAVIKFSGPGRQEFTFAWNLSLPDLTWCYTIEELMAVCRQVAGLQPIGPAPDCLQPQHITKPREGQAKITPRQGRNLVRRA